MAFVVAEVPTCTSLPPRSLFPLVLDFLCFFLCFFFFLCFLCALRRFSFTLGRRSSLFSSSISITKTSFGDLVARECTRLFGDPSSSDG